MGLRVCLVTPFAWSQPHDVNDHVAGVARELRQLGPYGHRARAVDPRARPARRTPRAPERRARRLRGDRPGAPHFAPQHDGGARRRAREPRARAGARRVRRRPRLRAGAAEPLVPRAPRHRRARRRDVLLRPTASSFPPAKAQRARLLGRIDALLATSKETATRPRERFPGDYTVISPGVDRELFRPAKKQQRIVVELVPGEREAARTAIRSLDELDGWEVVLLRQSALAGKPVRSPTPARPRPRPNAAVHGRARRPAQRGERVRARSGRQRAAGSGSRGLRRQRHRERRLRRGRRPSSTGSTAAWPAGGARSTSIATRSPIASGSPSTSTRTPRGPTTAASPPRSCSTRPRRSGSAQSPSPTTTSSAARWRRPSWHVAAT